MKKYVNFHEIVELRNSREMGHPMSMIFSGFPFDRSTFVLSREILLRNKAFVIDLSNTVLDFIPDGIFLQMSLGVNALSRHALLNGDQVFCDKECGRAIITGPDVADNLYEYLNVAAHTDDNQPIYIIGAYRLDKDCAKLIADISDAGTHDVIISVSALDRINYPRIHEFVEKFSEVIMAGRRNIFLFSPETHMICEDGAILYRTPYNIYYVVKEMINGPLDESLAEFEIETCAK